MVVLGGKNSKEKYLASLGNAAILFVIFSIVLVVEMRGTMEREMVVGSKETELLRSVGDESSDVHLSLVGQSPLQRGSAKTFPYWNQIHKQ